MKEKVFDFLLAATVAAVVSILVILQDASLDNAGILTMACVGSIAGIIAGGMKMVVQYKFDKWTLLASILGSAVVYAAVALGVWFRILGA